MVMENLVEDDEVQVNGVVLLVDLDLIGASHAMTLGPNIAKKLTSIFQVSQNKDLRVYADGNFRMDSLVIIEQSRD